MSQGLAMNMTVRESLLRDFAGASDVVKATDREDRSGVDWWAVIPGRGRVGIDLKARQSIDLGDLALETWSVCPTSSSPGRIGWARDHTKRCDYILFYFEKTGRHALLPFPMLCSVFSAEWVNWSGWDYPFPRHRQTTTRQGVNAYESECLFVPADFVWSAITTRYGLAGGEA